MASSMNNHESWQAKHFYSRPPANLMWGCGPEKHQGTRNQVLQVHWFYGAHRAMGQHALCFSVEQIGWTRWAWMKAWSQGPNFVGGESKETGHGIGVGMLDILRRQLNLMSSGLLGCPRWCIVVAGLSPHASPSSLVCADALTASARGSMVFTSSSLHKTGPINLDFLGKGLKRLYHPEYHSLWLFLAFRVNDRFAIMAAALGPTFPKAKFSFLGPWWPHAAIPAKTKPTRLKDQKHIEITGGLEESGSLRGILISLTQKCKIKPKKENSALASTCLGWHKDDEFHTLTPVTTHICEFMEAWHRTCLHQRKPKKGQMSRIHFNCLTKQNVRNTVSRKTGFQQSEKYQLCELIGRNLCP